MTLIRFRRATAAAWSTANPVLQSGEPGYETDTGVFRIGDGTTSWGSLEPIGATAFGIPVSEQAGATSLIKMQNAVTAAATLGTWAIIDGNYTIAGTVNVPTGSRIDCSRGTVTQATDLTPMFKAFNVTNIRFREPNLIGKGTDYVNTSAVYDACGIWLVGTTSDVIVDGGTMTSIAGLGLRVSDTVSNWKIRNCKITGPGAPPVVPSTSNFGACIGMLDGCTDWSIIGCELSQHAQGIVTGEIDRFIISQNYIHNIVGQHGMYLEPGSDFSVRGNLIKTTVLQGIKLQIPFNTSPDDVDGVVTGNTIIGCGSHNILVTNVPGGSLCARRIKIADNVLVGDGAGGGDGVQCSYADNISVTDNIIYNVRKGVNLATCTNLDVLDNRITTCTDEGVLVTNTSGFNISRNRIVDPATANGSTTEFGLHFVGASTADGIVDGNKVTDSGGNMRYGLYAETTIDQTTVKFRNNDSSGATDYGARLNSGTTLGEWANNALSGGTGTILNFPSTLTVKGAPIEYTGTAAPGSGTWDAGTIVWNRTPTAGGTLGWICVAGGTPGTWSSFGKSGSPWTNPADNAQLGGSFDVLAANTNAAAISAGILYLTKVDIGVGGAINNVNYVLGVVATLPTAAQNFVGVYQYAVGGSLLGGASADQSTNFGGTGQKAGTLSSPTPALNVGDSIYVAVLFNGTTGPGIRAYAATSSFVNLGVASLPRYATAGSGLTALPSTLPALAAATVPYWFGVS